MKSQEIPEIVKKAIKNGDVVSSVIINNKHTLYKISKKMLTKLYYANGHYIGAISGDQKYPILYNKLNKLKWKKLN